MAGQLRSVDAMLGPAVAETIRNLNPADVDTAAVRLAEQYAKAIDDARGDPDVLEKLGPRLLACLESLGATPRSRAAIVKGGAAGGQGKGKLQAVREAHRSA
ncbi:terminase small subunit [Micromonospora sp. WMMD558]|uniref:terminase small subunit n=1 Tax=Micromonospora sp. WMMD558 TaxID=3403462 RepID=UPI003BF475BB